MTNLYTTMINTKEDLKKCLDADLKRFADKPVSLKDFVLANERWFIYHYMKHLRKMEYCKNVSGGVIGKARFLYHFLLFKRLGHVMRITVFPNTVGEGFTFYHFGDFTHVAKTCRIGKNCTIQPGVVFGKKTDEVNSSVVGDNCYIGLGVKILGTVHIGNNVKIGANAVVTRDIPDDCIVAGIPAKIIKRYDHETKQWVRV